MAQLGWRGGLIAIDGEVGLGWWGILIKENALGLGEERIFGIHKFSFMVQRINVILLLVRNPLGPPLLHLALSLTL